MVYRKCLALAVDRNHAHAISSAAVGTADDVVSTPTRVKAISRAGRVVEVSAHGIWVVLEEPDLGVG